MEPAQPRISGEQGVIHPAARTAGAAWRVRGHPHPLSGVSFVTFAASPSRWCGPPALQRAVGAGVRFGHGPHRRGVGPGQGHPWVGLLLDCVFPGRRRGGLRLRAACRDSGEFGGALCVQSGGWRGAPCCHGTVRARAGAGGRAGTLLKGVPLSLHSQSASPPCSRRAGARLPLRHRSSLAFLR